LLAKFILKVNRCNKIKHPKIPAIPPSQPIDDKNKQCETRYIKAVTGKNHSVYLLGIMDLTFAEILAQIPEADPMNAWWASASALPENTTVSEFFAKTLKAASDAQRVKNTDLAVGSRIDGYPAPTNGAVTVNAANGQQSFITTYSVRSRVAVNLDVAVSPLA
jgi:hypothetical protein